MDLLVVVSALVSVVMTVVVFVALLRLFSIDASLKDIRNHLLRTEAKSEAIASAPGQMLASKSGPGARTAFRVIFVVLMCAVAALIIGAIATARH